MPDEEYETEDGYHCQEVEYESSCCHRAFCDEHYNGDIDDRNCRCGYYSKDTCEDCWRNRRCC
jgi:hypothetical protein